MLIMAPVCTGAVLYLLWSVGVFLPRWCAWKSETLYDTSGEYEIVLRHREAAVLYDGSVIWNSPAGVKVQQVLSCDVDNDGKDELVLLCWKVGRFGDSKPFWIEKDEKKWSQHIFIYEYGQGRVKPGWMSSYIGQDVVKMAVRNEETGSGFRTHLLLTGPDGKISSWVWDSWGFTKEETEVSFVVFGDNLMHEAIYRFGLHNGGNFDFLYENVRDMIKESDISVINQETPLTDNPSMYGDYPRFGTPAGVGEAIADAGFDVVTCATNHALDRGARGVDFTKNYFDTRGITCLGIQTEEEPEYCPFTVVVRNGIRFAMLNYTYGTNGIRIPEEYPEMVHLLEDEDKIRRDIQAAKAGSDFVLVFVHWGTEYEESPDDFQKKWAEVFLESGVDVVVGAHPHVLQPYEMLRDGNGHEMLVYYSIGNFVSAQYEENCVKGGAAKFTVSLAPDGYQVTEYSLYPLTIVRQEGGLYTVVPQQIPNKP